MKEDNAEVGKVGKATAEKGGDMHALKSLLFSLFVAVTFVTSASVATAGFCGMLCWLLNSELAPLVIVVLSLGSLLSGIPVMCVLDRVERFRPVKVSC